MTKRLIGAAALLSLLALGAGCAGEQPAGNANAGARANTNAGGANTAGANTAGANTGAGANASAPANAGTPSAAAGQTVEVKLTEFKVEMPASVSAGPTTFRVTNAGKAEHSFEIEGQGVEKALDSELGAGETKTLQVDLKPGTYEIYCPVANHKGRGMETKLTVK